MGLSDFFRKIGLLRTYSSSWKGDAKDRPLDDPDQQQKMADLDRKIDDATDSKSDSSSDSSSE